MPGVVEVELLLIVGELDLEKVAHLHTLGHPQNDVEVRRSQFFTILEQDRHLLLAEVGLRECPELVEGAEDPALFVIEAYFFIDGVVAVDLGRSIEYSEVGVLVLEGLLGLQAVVVGVDAEVIEQEDVANLDVDCEVLLAVAPEVDVEGFVLLGCVNDLQFLGVIAILFISEYIGAVGDQSDGRK